MANQFKRIICLVADGFGVGAAPDAKDYGDEGSNTLGHVASSLGGIRLPNLEKLGIGNLGDFKGISKVANPKALSGRLAEKSSGKDTTTGHWEIAGLVTKVAFATFPNGFSETLLNDFIREAKVPGILGNKAASGTVIIEELGEEHMRTGKPIVYTSGDSVFQIAAHEKSFGLERLYEVCQTARALTLPLHIGRVIARPFVGASAKDFKRTQNRRDYSVVPSTTVLDVLQKKGIPVLSVGKIEDIFAHRGISFGNHTGNNLDSLKATVDYFQKHENKEAFIFTNLVDFDQLYGHRRDAVGYGNCLVELDTYLPKILGQMTDTDLLIVTSDHGCDPTFKGTDHTREYVPLLAYSPALQGKNLGDRSSFADIAGSVLAAYGIDPKVLPDAGKSFLGQ